MIERIQVRSVKERDVRCSACNVLYYPAIEVRIQPNENQAQTFNLCQPCAQSMVNRLRSMENIW